ncbi:MAG: Phox domain-containing isoform 1 [Trebouxia sp. A1-2]|nr:MAG: Phox domain-containing isoform 1 [Trebouxia sp. A1-2]
MASNGWQFSVTIPSWTQATLEGDENIVFYRVEVKVLPPEADAAPRTRSVLRRFSHFTKLHARLKEELGNKKMAKLEPPSKNRLVGVNKRPDLVEKRRRELESWLWKLIGDGEIARSRVLNNFLELSDAARLVQRVAPSPLPSRPASQTGSYAWSEGGSSSMHEGSSQQSSAAPSNADFSLHGPGLDGLPHVRPGLPPLQRSASDGTQQIPTTQGLPQDTHPQPMARSASTSAGTSANASIASTASAHHTHARPASLSSGVADAATATQEPRMRLGLRVEQRVTVKHHVKALQQQLDRAAGDLQDAMEAIYTERHTKRQLAGQLADLQARASESGVTQAAAREADLASSVELARDTSAQLQQDLASAQASVTALQSQLSDSRALQADTQQQLSTHQSRITSLQSQLQHVREELTASQQAAAAADAARQESDTAAAGISQQLTQSQQSVSDLQWQLEQAQESAAAAQAQQNEQEHVQSDSVSESEARDSDQPTVAPPADALSAMQGEVESGDATPSGQSLQDLQAQKAAAEEKAAAMRDEMVAFKRRVADAEAKSRSDRKVLAREVKALRKQLEQAAAKEAEHAARESEHATAEQAAAASVADAAEAQPAAAVSTSDEHMAVPMAAHGPTGADEQAAFGSVAATPAASTSAVKVSISNAVSYTQLLQEVAALRQRLHDNSIEVFAAQTAAGQELKPQEAMDMLSTCDGRLQALMAEANLLGETATSQMQTSTEDLELRQAFSSILIESGALRQQINALLRDKFEAEAHSRNAQTQQTAPDVKGLFRKFTPGMPFLGPQSNGASKVVEEDAAKPAFGQGIGDRFAGFGDRFSKSFSRPQQ